MYMKTETKFLIGGVALILIILGGVIWYMATHPAPEPGDLTDATGFEGETEKTIADKGDYHEIEATYPASTPLKASAGVEADAQAVLTFKTFEEQTIATFKEQSGLLSLTQEDVTMFGLDQGRKYALDIDYTVEASPTTLSYIFTIYEDTLGAHPNGYYRTFTFDRSTGQGLMIGQIFELNVDYTSFLSERTRAIVLAGLARDMQVDESEVDTFMLDGGTSADEDNFQNFYLTESELVIIFPPYQVAPYVAGTREARIPKTELGAMLKAKYR